MASFRPREGAERFIPPDALRAFGAGSSASSIMAALLAQQQQVWPLLHAGYASLASVQTREFAFDGFVVKVQFNPGRITSSAAKVDAQSIRERRCFLCLRNLPREQRGVQFGEDYVILCNPFPIFPEHFTIPHRDHVPQLIDGSFGVLLDLARAMGDRYTLFYNGPRCGASAPDHLHFQAGLKGFMPIDTEYPGVVRRFGRLAGEQDGVRCLAVEGYLRRFYALESSSPAALAGTFARLAAALLSVLGSAEEPMMNILVSFDGAWRVLVFPRARHRPSFFFAEGDAKMLISPAAVDLGGVCITPLEKDFHRITREDIAGMFDEVTLGKPEFDAVASTGFRTPTEF